MGLSAQWYAVRIPDELTEIRARNELAQITESAPVPQDGWLWAFTWEVTGAAEETTALSSALAQPVLGGFVLDSDFGLLIGTDESGNVAFEFPVNQAHDEYEEFERYSDIWTDPQQRRQAAEALAAWAKSFAPTPLTAEAVLAGMPGPDSPTPPSDDIFFGDSEELWIAEDDHYGWVFAEDGMRYLNDRLGFGQLDELTWGTENDDDDED